MTDRVQQARDELREFNRRNRDTGYRAVMLQSGSWTAHIKRVDASSNRVQEDGSAEWLLGHAACFIRECGVTQHADAGMIRLYNHLEKIVAHAIPNHAAKLYTPAEVADIAEEQFKAGLKRGRDEGHATRNRACDHQWRHAGHIGPGTERSVCLLCGIVLVET